MRSTAIRRTVLAATAVSLALLATACGGSGSDDKGADAKGKASKAPVPATKALTAAELEKVSLAQGDVKGNKVAEAAPKDLIAADKVTAKEAACDPFADALMGAEVGSPAAATHRQVVSEPKKSDAAKQDSEDAEEAFKAAFNITTTMTSLGAYEGKGADEAISSLRTAATGCAGGFDYTVSGAKQKVTKITEEQVKGGEEAAAWTAQVEQDGEKVPMKLVVLRQGTTLATFASLNLAASGAGGDFDLPTSVIDAQAAKLA